MTATGTARLSHGGALLLMLLVTLLWSMAGVVTRQVSQAQGLELTFWRSGFNALALLIILSALRTPAGLWRGLKDGGPWLLASGVCWAVMFTAFMWALTLTTVANVLVTMALGPLFTALLAWAWTGQRLARPTVLAIAVAGLGMVLMQRPDLFATAPAVSGVEGGGGGDSLALTGTLLALAVPLAGAINWILIHRHTRDAGRTATPDFLLAVLVGALLSALVTLPAAWPFQASSSDVAWLALLGVFQLAVPCLLAVVVARVLQPSEVALLSLLEVIFGVAWAWLGTAEKPQTAVLLGGAVVVLTLAAHEAFNWHRQR